MALEAAALVGCAERRGRSGVRAPRLVGVDDTWGSCARREWTGGSVCKTVACAKGGMREGDPHAGEGVIGVQHPAPTSSP
uniref:Uncharacterized protein n=1 Tax=Oryza glumipatula TaxID=40148 RepID=A0A0D9YNS7_9ORYZ